MNIQPIADRLVIKQLDAEKTTTLLLIPAEDEKTVKGVVLAVGAGRTLDDGSVCPMTVVVDDVVMFSANAANNGEVKLDGERYIIIKEADVVAIVK